MTTPAVYLPPRVRAVCYYTYAGLSAVAAAVLPILNANHVGTPLWLQIGTGALSAFGTAFGLVAATNTPRQSNTTTTPQHAAADPAGEKSGPEAEAAAAIGAGQ